MFKDLLWAWPVCGVWRIATRYSFAKFVWRKGRNGESTSSYTGGVGECSE